MAEGKRELKDASHTPELVHAESWEMVKHYDDIIFGTGMVDYI
jgi:hypothetical protein